MGENFYTLDFQWRSYVELVMPVEAEENQRIESRRAFYAGAQAVFKVIWSLDPGDDVTKTDTTKLDVICDELETFVKDVEEGRA